MTAPACINVSMTQSLKHLSVNEFDIEEMR